MKHENIGFPKDAAPLCKWRGCKNKTRHKSGECHVHQKVNQKLLERIAKQEQPLSASEQYAHRLAFILECALLDPSGTWEAAHMLLEDYYAAVRKEHEAAGEKYVSAFGKD